MPYYHPHYHHIFALATFIVVLASSFVVHGLETLTDVNFKTAVNLWIDDNPTALATYGNIVDWETSRVTDMKDAFKSKTTFNGDISKWDVSNVVTLEGTFYNAQVFNTDISNWNVQSVVSLKQTF